MSDTPKDAPTTPVLQCDECGVLTFDLMRMGEIHNCQRAGEFRLKAVETVRGDADVRRAVLYNPVCAAVYAYAQQEFADDRENLNAYADNEHRNRVDAECENQGLQLALSTLHEAARRYVEARDAAVKAMGSGGDGFTAAVELADKKFAALRSLTDAARTETTDGVEQNVTA